VGWAPGSGQWFQSAQPIRIPALVRIRFTRVGQHTNPLPARMTDGAAGIDLMAALSSAVVLEPRARAVVPTGFAVEIPRGYEGQVRPRSGLASKHGITVLNAPGTIDADYRGEVQVILVNLGATAYQIENGTRIAQLVVAPVADVEIEEAPALSTTQRGAGGFGSTGGA
jgi:dUTP pyrophosphatase